MLGTHPPRSATSQLIHLGLPKAAELSHYNLIEQHTEVHEYPQHPSPFEVSMLCALPFFHTTCAPYTHTSSLRSGLPSHIVRRFVPWPYLEAIAKHQTTRLMLVPPTVVALMNRALEDEARVTRCLRSVRRYVLCHCHMLSHSTDLHATSVS